MKTSNTGKEPGEDFNVRQKHGQIWRENAEPSERFNLIPWWLKHLIYAPLFIWALWYMLIYSGGFETEEYYEGINQVNYSPTLPANDKKNAPIQTAQASDGKAIYTQVCAVCHQANGQGLPGVFPPLASSDWVSQNPKKLSALILHGLAGEIVVNGVTYNGVMPPQGALLNDADIASVLTFIRSQWGNNSPAVKPSTVSEIRSQFEGSSPWTAVELDKQFPE